MSYFLSKTFLFFINPNNWLVVWLISLLLLRASLFKRRLIRIGVVVFFLLSNGLLYRTVMKAWQPAPVELKETYQAAVLLAGISSVSYYNQGYFGPASDRFIQTIKLYHSKKVKKIIISGGDGTLFQNGFKESIFLKKEMMASGVSENDIYIDTQSRNTYENAVHTKKLLDSLQWKGKMVLVSSAMHLPRAKGLFVKQGMDVISYPCNYEKCERNITGADVLIPDFSLLQKWNLLLKEWFGILVNKMTGKQ